MLRPGGKVAFFDSTAGPAGEPHFPLPWADDPRASFLVRGALGEIARQRFDPTVDPSQVGLRLLMPDYEVRMANIGRSIAEGRLALIQDVLRAV